MEIVCQNHLQTETLKGPEIHRSLHVVHLETVMLSDLDFADDIALLSNQIREAQELLDRVETECKKVGLHLNAKKTEYMAYNIIL